MTETNISEASILLSDTGRFVTLPKPLRELLKAHGWKSGQIFLAYDEKKDVLKVFRPEKLSGYAAGLI
jgi:hypothetical protein